MKNILIIAIAAIVGVVGGGVGGYFLASKLNPANQVVVEEETEIDLKDCSSLVLEDVTIPLKRVSSKAVFMKANFIITLADEEALTTAEKMKEYYRSAILSVFESKTVAELDGKRNDMREPVLQAIRELYNSEEDREKIIGVDIPVYTLPNIPE